ncbi:MAG: secretion protein HylD [Panacagrimonas sp.]|jgi:adhesin transport system membrane fusion protein|nr:HlyD family type I secretion periplasmic adaptor subunit [Panacagrimonas sp.]MCC2655562.1 secretion protein HylD [Panacagrimonas sp.]
MNAPNPAPVPTSPDETASLSAPLDGTTPPAPPATGLSKLQARFDRLGGWIEQQQRRWLPPGPDPNQGWGADSEWARLQQEPLRARALVRWTALFFVVITIWAAFAEIDEVTKGEGRVIPSSQLQILQSVDGGVVETIEVKEGQTVAAGAMLLRIDPTRFESTLRDNRSQYLALRIKAARLEALISGGDFAPPAKETSEAPDLVGREMALFQSSREELEAGIAIAKQQVEQRRREIDGATARYTHAVQGLELASRELDVTRPLVNSGAVSEVEVLRLEREVSTLTGERDLTGTQIKVARAALNEAQRKVEELTLSTRNKWQTDMAETMAKLNSLTESSGALVDRVNKAEIRSPVRGLVKRVLVNTVGGVVQPGQTVVEIVPLDDTLLLEAKITPRDIAFLRPQQEAMVKFTAYDFSIYGGLEADVDQIGADSVVDEKDKDKQAYYIVRVKTRKTSLGENLPILPGMVAEVDIITGKKTVLSYLLKPVLRAHAAALTER